MDKAAKKNVLSFISDEPTFLRTYFFTALVGKKAILVLNKNSTRPTAGSEGHEQHRDISVHKTRNVTANLFFTCLLCLIFKMNHIQLSSL